MDTIFFEKQVDLLCAQHALNMLLQGAYFSADVLAEIAARLDEEENSVLDGSSRNRESQNMNDSGFFSVQVISEALKTFQLEMTPVDHPSVAAIKSNPLTAKSFICNRSEHWFVIRRFGVQWFELNSVKEGPVLHTDTYVSLFMAQLNNDGYSIYVVQGVLPESDADRVITANPVMPIFDRVKPAKKDDKDQDKKKQQTETFGGRGQRLGGPLPQSDQPEQANNENDDLAEAIRRSLNDQAGTSGSSGYDNDDYEMKKAIEMSTVDDSEERSFQMALMMSMQQEAGGSSPAVAVAAAPTAVTTAAEQQRAQRANFLKRFEQ